MATTRAGLTYSVFPTAIGHCALVWVESAVVIGSALPQGSSVDARRAVARWYPDAHEVTPAGPAAYSVAAVVELLDGGSRDLAELEVDMSGVPEFDRRVYEVVRTIPPGSTLTYGEVAARLGAPGAAQAVGQAMGRNPLPPIVPCHRVLAAGRQVGGFSARGGRRTKLRMLEIEGVHLEQPTLFDL